MCTTKALQVPVPMAISAEDASELKYLSGEHCLGHEIINVVPSVMAHKSCLATSPVLFQTRFKFFKSSLILGVETWPPKCTRERSRVGCSSWLTHQTCPIGCIGTLSVLGSSMLIGIFDESILWLSFYGFCFRWMAGRKSFSSLLDVDHVDLCGLLFNLEGCVIAWWCKLMTKCTAFGSCSSCLKVIV